MDEAQIYRLVLWVWLALGAICLPVLFFVTAPYGRHMRDGWGPRIHRTLGWVVMESPTLWIVLLLVALDSRLASVPVMVLTAMWFLHYGHRVLIYPFRLRGGNKLMPASVAAMAFCFNLFNGYLQGRHLHGLGEGYPDNWLSDPRFLIGAALFLLGFAINMQSDAILRSLRKDDEDSGYKIPRGGLYRWVSCPNYFGEIIEWIGWALATWSFAGLAFALWVVANLAPRARSNHLWYKQQFSSYPPARRALVPFVF
jgi:3-oxo-5-alpha-steroid 4-dehydrogenase 1